MWGQPFGVFIILWHVNGWDGTEMMDVVPPRCEYGKVSKTFPFTIPACVPLHDQIGLTG